MKFNVIAIAEVNQHGHFISRCFKIDKESVDSSSRQHVRRHIEEEWLRQLNKFYHGIDEACLFILRPRFNDINQALPRGGRNYKSLFDIPIDYVMAEYYSLFDDGDVSHSEEQRKYDVINAHVSCSRYIWADDLPEMKEDPDTIIVSFLYNDWKWVSGLPGKGIDKAKKNTG